MDLKAMDTNKIAIKVLNLDTELTGGSVSAPARSREQELDALYNELSQRLSPPKSTRRSLRITADSELIFRVGDTARSLGSINVSETGLCVRGEMKGIKAGQQMRLVHVEHAGRGFDTDVLCEIVWVWTEGTGSTGRAGLAFARADRRPQVRSWYFQSYRTLLERLAAGAAL